MLALRRATGASETAWMLTSMIRAQIQIPDGPTLTFEADEMQQHNVLQDATEIGDSYRSHEASGDQLIILVKRGARSRSSKVDMALTCLDSIMRRDEGERWTRGLT